MGSVQGMDRLNVCQFLSIQIKCMYILPSFKLMFQIYSPNCVERLQTTPGCPRPY